MGSKRFWEAGMGKEAAQTGLLLQAQGPVGRCGSHRGARQLMQGELGQQGRWVAVSDRAEGSLDLP